MMTKTSNHLASNSIRIAAFIVLVIGMLVVIQYFYRDHVNSSLSSDAEVVNSRPAGETPNNAIEQSVQSLRQEVQYLKKAQSFHANELKGLKEQVLTNENKTGHQEGGEVQGVLTPESIREQQADDFVSNTLNTLEATFASEKRDGDWSSTAESAIDNVFRNGEYEKVAIKSRTCQATICRLELSFDDKTEQKALNRKIIEAIPWNNQGFFKIGLDDKENPYTLLYISREGHNLPINSTK